MKSVDLLTRTPTAVAASVPPDEAANGTRHTFSKVAQVTLAFWIVKICATTLGETGGDALSMTLNLGYAISTLIFLGFFAVTLAAQVASKRYHPLFYWAVIVATTTLGTTTSDFLDRTLGLGYVKSSVIELGMVIAVLAAWRYTTGSIAVDHITSRRNEIFYWVTILVANTLGTALGDFVATTTGLGFEGGALLFAGLLAVVAATFSALIASTSHVAISASAHARPIHPGAASAVTFSPVTMRNPRSSSARTQAYPAGSAFTTSAVAGASSVPWCGGPPARARSQKGCSGSSWPQRRSHATRPASSYASGAAPIGAALTA